MTDALKNWIIGITMTAFALSLAETMISQESIRKVLRLVGGVLLLAVMARPLLELKGQEWEISLSGYIQETAQLSESLAVYNNEQLAEGIAGELEAYISDKAKELGVEGEVFVYMEVKEDVPLPAGVKLNMPFHQELSEYIGAELGLGREEQIWQED